MKEPSIIEKKDGIINEYSKDIQYDELVNSTQKDQNITAYELGESLLSKEISFLNQKRKKSGGNSNVFKNNKKLSAIVAALLDENFSSANEQNKKKMKFIGITTDDIYSIERFKVDYANLPKFSKFSHVDDLIPPSASIIQRQNDNCKILPKKKIQNYSCIEKMNKENLKLIEQRRLKYKGVPKANKEKMDDERLKKYWLELTKHEICKMPRIVQRYKNEVEASSKRYANLVQKEIRKKVNRVQRNQKEYIFRAKRLQKEMLVFWRKREREMVDLQRKKNKIEIDRKKKEDELNEQIIQKKRMEYLLKQSDIYSLMMYKHLGAFMPQNEQNEENQEENKKPQPEKEQNNNLRSEVIAGKEVLVNTKTNKIVFQSIKVDIDEQKAQNDVNELINKQRQKANDFDLQLNIIRKTLGGKEVQLTNFDKLQDKQMNQKNEQGDTQLERLDKPMINNTSSQLIEIPKNFIGDLKEYQLKGLRWLDNLYSQGINGILADEMGLGKTIQAIAFLAHLSEEKNNWGPFLVIAPNATLYNWQQEFNRFCPALKVLPYWGALKERKTLRKFFNSSQLYIKSSSFHVCITSYQLAVTDEKVFHKVNWNYMILDEAQAIKNIASQRWNVLLSFNCRNRLLLSGTPIQNSMSELWALLHFIMPNLFDSHEQFQEWFSKDIEAHSQNKGELNQEQLKRLHKILKPFMLRRVKKDVENEIGPKVEHEILCEMTEKQKILYNSIKEKLSNIGDLFMSTDSKGKVKNLMNLVMQFRKVCNHPELFERNFGKVPFVFTDLVGNFGCNNMLHLANNCELIISNTNSLINVQVPKMVFDFCYERFNMLDYIPKRFFIFNNDNILDSLSKDPINSLFNFVFLLGFSLSQFVSFCSKDALINHIVLIHFFTQMFTKHKFYRTNQYHNKISLFIYDSLVQKENDYSIQNSKGILPPLFINNISTRKTTLENKIIRKRIYIPKVLAFTPKIVCSNSQLEIKQKYITQNLFYSKIFYGVDFSQYKNSINYKLPNMNREILQTYLPEQNGILTPLFYHENGGYSQIELPSFDRLISDCAKLKKLDELLCKLYAEEHRVLIFCQMTHMIDILEEYMSKKKYTYFRMDGSTQIADRRDMINEFQTNPKIFAFLLSTRAGGLGVNLTGADTVIFYDNDWNPTMDAQATDRAHRIGQTKMVSVYRLVTKNTVEERILKRAQQKKNVQTTVYSGGAFKADIFKQKDIVELLYSEEEMQKMEMDKKKILFELNNGIIEKKEGDLAVMEEEFNNNATNDNNNVYGSAKGKKKKGRKKAKDQKGIAGSNGKKKPQNIFGVTEDKKKNINQNNMNNNNKNIFMVQSNNAMKKNKFNENVIKMDSSDDENNIIIDDGEHPINMDMMENEEENENMDIDES